MTFTSDDKYLVKFMWVSKNYVSEGLLDMFLTEDEVLMGSTQLNSTQRLFANNRKYKHNSTTPNGRLPERPKPISAKDNDQKVRSFI